MLREVVNRSHREDWEKYKGGFEWFYFDGSTEDGTAFNIIFFEADLFGLSRKPYISFSALVPGREPIQRKIFLRPGDIIRQGSLLKVTDKAGKMLAEENEASIRLNLPFDDGVGLDLRVTKTASPYVVHGDGLLYRSPDSGLESYWVVQIPHASFGGEFRVDNKARLISGFCYQDHQWGNLPIQDWVDRWVWGRFSSPREAAVFFTIYAQNGDRLNPAFWVQDGEIKGLEVDMTPFLAAVARDVSAAFINGEQSFPLGSSGEVVFSVGAGGMMKHKEGWDLGSFALNYSRWAAGARLRRGQINVPMDGVAEFLQVILRSK